jgi:hypothetical protein
MEAKHGEGENEISTELRLAKWNSCEEQQVISYGTTKYRRIYKIN